MEIFNGINEENDEEKSDFNYQPFYSMNDVTSSSTDADLQGDCHSSEISLSKETHGSSCDQVDMMLPDIKQESPSDKSCAGNLGSSADSLPSSGGDGLIVQDGKQHYCPECGKSFSIKPYLKKHIKQVHGEKKYACEYCDYSSGHKHHLIRHRDSVHANLIPRDDSNECSVSSTLPSDSVPSFQCTSCDKKFTTATHRQRHYRAVHLKRKPYSCAVCDYKFSRRNHLVIHEKTVHLGVKDFICGECGQQFAQKIHLVQHVKTIHLAERPYKCSHCEKTFAQKGHLNRHIEAIHEGLKPYTCSECSKSFSRESYLLFHTNAVHTDNKLYICMLCEKKFSSDKNLKCHMKTHR